MKRIASLVFISILTLSIALPMISAYDLGVTIEQQIITMSISGSGLAVEENIKVNNNEYENVTSLRFWIQQDAFDIEILDVESGPYLSSNISGNIW